jgi:outer membrane biogenesis lipoprotein LolB
MKYHHQIVLATIMAFALLLNACTKAKTTAYADPNAQQHNQDISNTKSE